LPTIRVSHPAPGAEAPRMTLLLDTGPLVAAIDRSGKHHARCAALLESAEGPLLIPATFIVEMCWLLDERLDIEAAFLTSVATGELQHVTITAVDLARTAGLVRCYADLPLGAVDASVIAVAEPLRLADVATLDRRWPFSRPGISRSKTPPRSVLDVIPSLGNARYRCELTVRGERKTIWPISRLLSPLAASCAICSSCGVS
jgi:predicted nucleic acid-binding protein